MMPPRQARLIGALLMGDTAAVRAAGLGQLDAAGWSELLFLAGEDLLTPELAAPLAAPGLADIVPPEVIEHVLELRALNAERNARIAAQAAEMLPAFAEAGLHPMLLKGGRAFADPDRGRADRVMGDLDLLFPPDELDAAAATLQRVGYQRLKRDETHGEGIGAHEVGYFVRPGEPAPVDLHRALLRLPDLLPVEALFSRARPAVAFGAPVLVAETADEVLQRALHEMVHHRAYRLGSASIRNLLDVAVRLPGLGPEDWAQLNARSAGRAGAPVATALRLIGEVFGPRALPAEAAALAGLPLARLAAWRAMAKADAALPGVVDAAWGMAVGILGAHEHRPKLDGPLALWWARRFRTAARHWITPVPPGAGRSG